MRYIVSRQRVPAFDRSVRLPLICAAVQVSHFRRRSRMENILRLNFARQCLGPPLSLSRASRNGRRTTRPNFAVNPSARPSVIRPTAAAAPAGGRGNAAEGEDVRGDAGASGHRLGLKVLRTLVSKRKRADEPSGHLSSACRSRELGASRPSPASSSPLIPKRGAKSRRLHGEPIRPVERDPPRRSRCCPAGRGGKAAEGEDVRG